MSKETESRRSPSPVAKLMGLDGMPVPHRPSYKQQKKTPGNHSQRTVSPEKSQRRAASDDNQLYARSSRQQQKFKDVFEVQETSMKGSSSFSVPKIANLKPARTEMEFIHKKFMDARRLVTDEKLQGSKEFHDALEVLDSNKKLLLKYLQQPDSLFMKHLLDINDVLPHSNCIHTVSMKSSDDENHGCHDSGRKSVRRNPRKKHRKSRKHCSGHISPSDSNYVAKCPVESSRIKLEDDERMSIFPKRIVVLKPNLGKAQNSSSVISSSHAFQSDCRKPSESERTEIRGMETLRTKNHDDDPGVSSHEVRSSKEVSKKTRQVRENFEYGSMSSSLGIARHDRNASPFIGNDLEAGKCNTSDMFGLNGQRRSSSFRYKQSSLSAEAKKRLSERWKTTCDYHKTGVVSRSCTLAEMLAMPEKESTPAYMEPRYRGESGGKVFNDQCIVPFGISSRDGWKDICLEKLSRSRSLPASSTAFEIVKTKSKSLRMDPLVIPKEAFKWERKEAISENLCQREHIAHRNSRHRRRKSHSSICSLEEFNDPVLEICTSQNQDSDFKDNEPADGNLLVVEESTHFPVKDQTHVLESWMDLRVKSDEAIVSSNEELQPELSVHSVVEDISPSGDQDCFISKELSPEGSEDTSFHLKSISGLESPVSSKEADQPSPVSVLEPPFTDDLPPGSDCFESLSADLHGLRMQLKLLKLETEAFTESEETQHISRDEDGVEGSIGFPEERYACKVEDNWEFSYLTDILQNSAFKDTDPDIFIAMWHSLECPVDPSTFEELEKKYAVWSSQPRSERKLLFDRINLGILDIYQKFTDPYPWIRPPTIQVGHSEELFNNLCKFLAKQVKKVDEDIVEKVVGRTTQWLVLGYDVDVIGKEIERLMVDELITEVVDMYL
ncbi:uncharacterized protein LOC120090419 [Benincasa hispida]|uniref:uncharacterized protein LOC120090419 n=1 Tax=Benincasa hispida TaxID=102211 RepID=UPI0019001E2C|nr:uncharacterized protein LOC120090419 [Benincasa hispida]XP_038903992.1 uncharacterized protein LOC120090419 [Benincasa hispida]XP_038903993.1 uncharacterized protein LOC120090419 [Benincasa hispida]XP_038903994.1 uncharacterized protein LOC120090419 [Benincasa hispida]XP_038903995.1 uncharacterized protein LOC120090419 [Benincasa hispida]XP_038903996.1 uncharacterized protein LOC120090419 [Benincasa hispida]XP_038903997.1 uncharacterized protein LOC120090419 [Benincasa hispida]XP_03890399